MFTERITTGGISQKLIIGGEGAIIWDSRVVVGEVGCRRSELSDKRTKNDFKVQYSDTFISCRRSGMSEKWDVFQKHRKFREGSLLRQKSE